MRLRRAVVALGLATIASLLVSVGTSLRMEFSTLTCDRPGWREFVRTAGPTGWVELWRGRWYSQAWFIPDTEATRGAINDAWTVGLLRIEERTIAFDRLPAWVELPRDVIGSNWQPSTHESFGTRCTAFGFPFRSVYGVVSMDEAAPWDWTMYLSRYLAIADHGMPPAVYWGKRVTNFSVDERWIPMGVLPLGVVLDALCFWPLVYVPMIGIIAGARRVRGWLRRRAGTCPRCRYSLAGLEGLEGQGIVCPECGSAIPGRGARARDRAD